MQSVYRSVYPGINLKPNNLFKIHFVDKSAEFKEFIELKKVKL